MAFCSGEKNTVKNRVKKIVWFIQGFYEIFLKKREEGVIRAIRIFRPVGISIPFQQDISPFLLVYMRIAILSDKGFELPRLMHKRFINHFGGLLCIAVGMCPDTFAVRRPWR